MQTNGNDDPLCKLSGENFVFYGEVVSHHKNEWVRNARDRKAISPKKEKTSSLKNQPKPSLNIARRQVGRPKGSKKGVGSKPEPKLEDVARVESGGTLTLASKVKVERLSKFKPLFTVLTSFRMILILMMMMMIKEYFLFSN